MKKWLISAALVFSLTSPVLAEGGATATANEPAEPAATVDISSSTAQLSILAIMAVGLGLLVYIGKKS